MATKHVEKRKEEQRKDAHKSKEFLKKHAERRQNERRA